MYRTNAFQNSQISNIQNAKYNSLKNAFSNLGLTPSKSLDQNEYRLFLNNRSPSGYFDSILCDKLFQFLNLNENDTISISEFIQGFLLFEEDIKRSFQSTRLKLAKVQQIYNKILRQCIIHKSEQLNEEGFADNAKIYGEIKDIDIRQKLKGIKEIIILVIFNEKREELHFEIGSEASNIKKSFEFRPTSRKDHFEFVMKGINDSGNEFNIGSKVFPLDGIESREKYLVQITVPDLDNPKQIAAFINVNIVLYMSYLNYYETLRKKTEKKINKYRIEAKQYFEDLQNIKDIYSNFSQTNYEINDGLYTERKGYSGLIHLDDKLYNFSNRSLSPEIERKNIEYYYRNNYNSPIKVNIINQTEKQSKKIVKKKQNFTSNQFSYMDNMNQTQRIQRNFPSINQINLEQGPNYLSSSKGESNYQDINQTNINNKSQQIYLNNQIKTNKNNYYKQQIEAYTNSKKISHPQSQIFQNYQQTSKKLVKNMSSPQYIQIQNSQQKESNVDLRTNSMVQNQNIQTNSYNLSNYSNTNTTKNLNTTNIEQTQTQTQTQTNNANMGVKVNEQQDENQKKVITEVARASVHQVVGEITKKKTVTTETKFLSPIRKKTIIMQNKVANGVVTEKINKEIVEEKTLRVSYLPQKVNQLIYINQIITLPIIFAGKKVTYKSFESAIRGFNAFANQKEKKINDNNINIWNSSVNNNSYNFDDLKILKVEDNIMQNSQGSVKINSSNNDNLSNTFEKINLNQKLENIESSKFNNI